MCFVIPATVTLTTAVSGNGEVFGFQNPTAVFKWMKGTSLPTVDNLVILADLFGVTIEDILVIRKNENTAVA